MNEFVEECRREWRRLRVPEPVANEMAADLAADLEEAEAEGVSPEEVLGSGASDPRSFATAWAAERGVIQRPPPSGHGLTGRSRLAATIGTFGLIIAIVGAVLVILASPPAPEILASPHAPERRLVLASPPVVFDYVAQPVGVVSVRIDAVEMNDSGVDTRTVGWVLLIVGLAGVVPSTLFLLWRPGRGRAAERTTTTV